MAQAWFESIKDELAAVEEQIFMELQSENDELNEMCRYVVSAGGKRVRPSICILSYLACGGKDVSQAISLGAAFEIVHTASLVHDDINDKSEVRRGRRTLHKEFCVSKAIVTGDYMLAKGFRSMGATSNEIVNIIVDAASRMSEGEFVQKDFEHSFEVTEDDYYKIIHGKTAVFIRACAECGAFLAGANEKLINILGKYAESIGMAFQIIDDTLDVIGNVNNTGKKVGLDLIEGKPTLPTILAMKDPVYGDKIKKVFMKSEPTEEDVAEALDLIKKTPAIEMCRQKASNIIDKAIDTISSIEDSVFKDSFISLARYIGERDR